MISLARWLHSGFTQGHVQDKTKDQILLFVVVVYVIMIEGCVALLKARWELKVLT